MGTALAFTIAVSLLISSAITATASVEPEVIRVGGKVLCQDCTQNWKEWVQGTKPIKGCKVSITCTDERGRVMYYASDLTDELGEYNIEVKKHIRGKELNAKLCALRLVSSPDPTCNVFTDFGGGRSGVKLGRPNLVYRNLIKYILNPFYYTTPMCEKPDISQTDASRGNEY